MTDASKNRLQVAWEIAKTEEWCVILLESFDDSGDVNITKNVAAKIMSAILSLHEAFEIELSRK